MSGFTKILQDHKKRNPKAKVKSLEGELIKRLKEHKLPSQDMCGWTDDMDRFRCSQLANICPVKTACCKIHGPKETLTDHVGEFMMNMGTDFHAYAQDHVLSRMDILYGNWRCRHCDEFYKDQFYPKICINKRCQCEKDFQYIEYVVGNDFVTGHVDGLIDIDRLVNDSSKMIPRLMHFEIKTCGSRAFENIKYDISALPIYYRYQATAYQKLLIEAGYIEEMKTLFWYINRDTMKMLNFVYEGEEELWEAIEQKWKLTQEILNESATSDMIEEGRICASPQTPVAKKCQYANECWKM